jgi:hypothetical protein
MSGEMLAVVNGTRRLITKNLASALREFRRQKGHGRIDGEEQEPLLRVWDDAICRRSGDLRHILRAFMVLEVLYTRWDSMFVTESRC